MTTRTKRRQGKRRGSLVQLWTWHTPDFSLTEGFVDCTKSRYYQETEGVAEAYCELFSRLETDQIIWCYTSCDEHKSTGLAKVRWALEVPGSEVFRYVDEIVWNRILGIECQLPLRLYYEWKDKAIRRHPNDHKARRIFHKEKSTEFWSREPPQNGWWDSLFVDKSEGEEIWALLQHPIPSAWVKSR